MIPAFLKSVFSAGARQPVLRFADARLCGLCDAVQAWSADGRCVECGGVLLSLARLIRYQEEQIAQLTQRVQALEPIAYLAALRQRPRGPGYDPVMLLTKQTPERRKRQ